ncbi:hypothetical protein AB3X52_15115 [Nocardioides sp. DS6]|uniref:Uncharacterized protein n=1 Tax=Nocardioides eburneus TaxID=3231482 RepID=A0ABV3T182_9ACTN
MQVPAVILPLLLRLDGINQQPPKDDDVVAGWMAFLIFILLIVAVALLGWSLTRQFKKVRAAQEAGVFGEDERPSRIEADRPDDEGAELEKSSDDPSEEQSTS